MLNSIMIYLLIGGALNFLFDKALDKFGLEENRLTNSERVIMTALWPIALIVFSYSFIKEFFSK
jgi:hypothetical protein